LVSAAGAVDVYFGSKALVGEGRNWIQIIPGKGWFMILRVSPDPAAQKN